jgi:hypothetical protein
MSEIRKQLTWYEWLMLGVVVGGIGFAAIATLGGLRSTHHRLLLASEVFLIGGGVLCLYALWKSPLRSGAAKLWVWARNVVRHWRITSEVNDTEWLVGACIVVSRNTTTGIDFDVLCRRFIGRMDMDTLVDAVHSLVEKGVVQVNICPLPDPRAQMVRGQGHEFQSLYQWKKVRETDDAWHNRFVAEVKRRSAALPPRSTASPYVSVVESLNALQQIGIAFECNINEEIWGRQEVRIEDELRRAKLGIARTWRERVADALPNQSLRDGLEGVTWLHVGGEVPFLDQSVAWLDRVIGVLSMPEQKPNRERISFEEAIKRLAKLPPQAGFHDAKEASGNA